MCKCFSNALWIKWLFSALPISAFKARFSYEGQYRFSIGRCELRGRCCCCPNLPQRPIANRNYYLQLKRAWIGGCRLPFACKRSDFAKSISFIGFRFCWHMHFSLTHLFSSIDLCRFDFHPPAPPPRVCAVRLKWRHSHCVFDCVFLSDMHVRKKGGRGGKFLFP